MSFNLLRDLSQDATVIGNVKNMRKAICTFEKTASKVYVVIN